MSRGDGLSLQLDHADHSALSSLSTRFLPGSSPGAPSTTAHIQKRWRELTPHWRSLEISVQHANLILYRYFPKKKKIPLLTSRPAKRDPPPPSASRILGGCPQGGRPVTAQLGRAHGTLSGIHLLWASLHPRLTSVTLKKSHFPSLLHFSTSCCGGADLLQPGTPARKPSKRHY